MRSSVSITENYLLVNHRLAEQVPETQRRIRTVSTLFLQLDNLTDL